MTRKTHLISQMTYLSSCMWSTANST